jgi:acetyl esterase/lipase
VVVGVNYRKADKYPFPAARDDLRASIAYIKDNASYLGVDADRIALLGRSAGGQLALLVAYEEDDPAIRGVVSFYAPTDMVYGFNNPTDTRVIDTPATLGTYLRGTPATSREHYDAASPINFVGENSPPTLLLHGSQDEMVHAAQSDRLSQQLAKFGVDHLYLKLPWATHGFDHNLWGPGGQISTYSVERFMHSLLRK